MQCDICRRPSDARLSLNCTSCSRNALYVLRIQQARVLLESEALGREVEKSVGRPSKNSPNAIQLHNQHPAYSIETACAERVQLEERTASVIAQANLLQRQTSELRAYMSKKKTELSQRRANLGSAIQGLSKRTVSDLEPLEKDIKRTKDHWDALHAKTVEARSFLCREAAQLYGLQHRKRRKGGPARDVYLVGGSHQ